MTIDINGDVIQSISIDGEFTEEVTVDGDIVFQGSAIPDSGVSRLTFDDADTEGGTALDVWGNNDGTINGATTGVSGIAGYDSGQAYSFGGDDYVSLPAYPNFSAFSVSIWVNGDGGTAVGLTENNNIEIRENNNTWAFRMNNSTYIDGPGGNFNSDTHLVATWDGSTREWFVNASSQGTLSTTTNGQKAEGTAIGRRSDVGGFEAFLTGVADDFRVYDGRLTATEVSNLYNTGSIDG